MAVNSLFHTSNLHSIATERNLYSDLIKEAIQIYGHDVYYMDRTLVGEDMVLGIDSISQYKNQHPIEMYMEDADGGFAGEKELMNQFGLQNLSEAIFVVNKERFQELDAQVQIESGTDTSSSGSLLLEAGSVDQSSSASTLTTVTGDNNFYIIQDIAVTDADRPQEGDAIYHPVLDKMFQVNFVDHDEPFYQLDNNPVYKLHCRLYDYSSEVIDTGITALDAIETEHSLDALVHQFTLEQSSAVNEEIRLEYTPEHELLLIDSTDGSADAGDNIIGEDDTQSAGESIMLERPADTGDDQYLIQEDYIVGDMSTDMTSQNEYFETQSRPILDFSESNPFGDAGSSS
ncbi:MAG: hypothetical protein QGH83_04990 [Candidatus Pacebacteria bacterium]|jgi:hypothetical protein|nr:hypothetical protein [Candidatus Paceibacterota bacterium]